MEKTSSKVLRVILQIFLLVILYSICRLLFILINQSELNTNSFGATLPLFLYGLRFDISGIFMINSPFLIFSLLPAPFIPNLYYQKFLKYLFIISNGFFFFLNFIDIAYFPFIHKRMQSDAFYFITGDKGTDLFNLIPQFIIQHWYLLLLFILMVFILIKGYNYTVKNKKILISPSLKTYSFQSIIFLFAGGLTVLAIRGGIQLKPIDIIDAPEMADVQNAPVILNTPFSIIKSIDKRTLNEVHFFADDQFQDCEKGIHMPYKKESFKKMNVVVIVVESLSKNYISYFNGPARTPFLDSLFSQSLVFSNGFANAKESIQGIPAVLASIPSLQDEAFVISTYCGNKVTSLANLLKEEGYTSSFFHGGKTGTMRFNAFSKLAGFDNYYGKEDYNNENDFDGNWGIWDEPFLQFMADNLSATSQPFLGAILTLNTHHPFSVPEKYKNKFKQDGHPIYSCFQYTDYSLSLFFNKIKNKPWFKNTLFIITADHTGPRTESEVKNVLDDYRVPIVFYRPDGSLKGTSEKIANQIDILPSVMHLLNYPYPYFSYGKNLFDDHCEDFAVNYNAGIYQYIDSLNCCLFNGNEMLGIYNWKIDGMFEKNILKNLSADEQKKYDEKIKKVIQVFNNSLIRNKMWVDSK